MDNFADSQGFQENFNETVDLNLLLNKQVAGLTSDISEGSITLPDTYETGVKTTEGHEKKSSENTTHVVPDLNLQMDLTNVQNPTLPIFTSLDSSLCENANVICVSCGTTTSLKDLETHNCTEKLPAVTIEKVDKVNLLKM